MTSIYDEYKSSGLCDDLEEVAKQGDPGILITIDQFPLYNDLKDLGFVVARMESKFECVDDIESDAVCISWEHAKSGEALRLNRITREAFKRIANS